MSVRSAHFIDGACF